MPFLKHNAIYELEMSLVSQNEIYFILYSFFLFVWQRHVQVPSDEILQFAFYEILRLFKFILLPLQLNKVCPQNLRLVLELDPQPLQ